jgi:hypothetical protein
MPLGSFRCRPVSVVRSFPFPSVAQDSGTQAQRRSPLAAFPEFPEEPFFDAKQRSQNRRAIVPALVGGTLKQSRDVLFLLSASASSASKMLMLKVLKILKGLKISLKVLKGLLPIEWVRLAENEIETEALAG